jgi:hypothetical protein
MAKETSKPSQLSEEFVHESNDESDNSMLGVENSINARADSKAAEDVATSDESDSANPDSGSDDSEDSSDAESEASSGSKKRSRNVSTSEIAPVPLAKRPKKR